jgi:hypothetical protein
MEPKLNRILQQVFPKVTIANRLRRRNQIRYQNQINIQTFQTRKTRPNKEFKKSLQHYKNKMMLMKSHRKLKLLIIKILKQLCFLEIDRELRKKKNMVFQMHRWAFNLILSSLMLLTLLLIGFMKCKLTISLKEKE